MAIGTNRPDGWPQVTSGGYIVAREQRLRADTVPACQPEPSVCRAGKALDAWPLSVGKKIAGRFDGVGSSPSFGSGTWLQTITVGASLAQVARYLGWDPGSLKRYLDGTWRISPDRHDALEAT